MTASTTPQLPQQFASQRPEHAPGHGATKLPERLLRRIARRPVFAAAMAAGIVLAAIGAPLGVPSPAHAQGSVSVSVVDHPELTNVADSTYLTQLRVSGSGFQSIKNGHGGIYVLFGWVEPGQSWRPSNGGTTGGEYRYVPDDETNPAGYALFVSFPGGDTEYAANGGEVDADGNWSGVISVPGSSFQAFDRSGNPTNVDCASVQCGIITIGAHGVKNANNESFTPVNFTDLYGPDAATKLAPPAAPAAAPESAPTPTIISSTITAEAPVATASSSTDDLIPILTGAIIGVGVLAVGAVAFLVWAVLSGRRKAKVAVAGGDGAGGSSGDSSADSSADTAAGADRTGHPSA